MKIEEVTRPSRMVNKTVSINLKITPEISEFLKENNLSPTLIFDTAVNELIEGIKIHEI